MNEEQIADQKLAALEAERLELARKACTIEDLIEAERAAQERLEATAAEHQIAQVRMGTAQRVLANARRARHELMHRFVPRDVVAREVKLDQQAKQIDRELERLGEQRIAALFHVKVGGDARALDSCRAIDLQIQEQREARARISSQLVEARADVDFYEARALRIE